jgi:hypothetical protein
MRTSGNSILNLEVLYLREMHNNDAINAFSLLYLLIEMHMIS